MAKEKFSLENLSQLSKAGMAREEEITEKLKKLPRLSKKAMAREEEITEKLKQLPKLKSKRGKAMEEALEDLRAGEKETMEKSEDVDDKFDFSDVDAAPEKTEEALEDLRAEEAKKIRHQEKKEAEEKYEEVEPEQIIEEKDLHEKKSPKKLRAAERKKIKQLQESIKEPEAEKTEDNFEEKGGTEMKRHLRSNLLSYPELLTPEIKKNLQIIAKQEEIIQKNEGNAKKSAQEKIKTANEVIKRSQGPVNDYADEIIKQYNSSHKLLMETSNALFGKDKPGKKQSEGGLEHELNAMYQEKFGEGKSYAPKKKGLFGGISGFFRDRKIRKAMGKDWDEFQVKEAEYNQKLDFYNQLLSSHAKRYGRLEEALESGSSFHIAHRGKSFERMTGVRGH